MKAAVDAFEYAIPLRTRIESTAHAAAETSAQISLLIAKLPDSANQKRLVTHCGDAATDWDKVFHHEGHEEHEVGSLGHPNPSCPS
jgi:hypothetical protein